ncbi:hypothetical protein Tco_0887417 [Tanacetum coccineum]
MGSKCASKENMSRQNSTWHCKKDKRWAEYPYHTREDSIYEEVGPRMPPQNTLDFQWIDLSQVVAMKQRLDKGYAFVRFLKVDNVRGLLGNLARSMIRRVSSPPIPPASSPALVLDDSCMVARDLDNFVMREKLPEVVHCSDDESVKNEAALMLGITVRNERRREMIVSKAHGSSREECIRFLIIQTRCSSRVFEDGKWDILILNIQQRSKLWALPWMDAPRIWRKIYWIELDGELYGDEWISTKGRCKEDRWGFYFSCSRKLVPFNSFILMRFNESIWKAMNVTGNKLLVNCDFVQKAKVRWAIEGDENSKFFHGIINRKRANLSVKGIMIEGEWVDDPIRVKDEFRNHFADRFNDPGTRHGRINFYFPIGLDFEQVSDLETSVSDEEIRKAVWGCGENKSPGPDGFTFEFFRKFWTVVGPDFCIAVKWFFEHRFFATG